jgi:hypothetical protein
MMQEKLVFGSYRRQELSSGNPSRKWQNEITLGISSSQKNGPPPVDV